MPIVTSKEMMIKAQKGGYAVPAFNVENMEMAEAVIKTAQEMKSPVIIQTTPSTLKYASPEIFAAIVKAVAKDTEIPVAIHLDHGSSFELAAHAIEAGYTSVMIDGSRLEFDDNAALTRKVVEYAKAKGIPVEGELGKVGGKEDAVDGGVSDRNTNPKEAAEFARITGLDSLAIAIGTAHGLYKSVPKIDVERLKEIRSVVDVPLVLHGTTGVDDSIVKQCVKNGICKVNYATELRVAYTDGIKQTLLEDPEVFDPKTYGRKGMDMVAKVVRKNIGNCLSQNRI